MPSALGQCQSVEQGRVRVALRGCKLELSSLGAASPSVLVHLPIEASLFLEPNTARARHRDHGEL